MAGVRQARERARGPMATDSDLDLRTTDVGLADHGQVGEGARPVSGAVHQWVGRMMDVLMEVGVLPGCFFLGESKG